MRELCNSIQLLLNCINGVSSVVEHRVSIETLLVPSSIPELAMRRCVFGKDNLCFLPVGAKQSTHVVIQPDESLANRRI